MSTPPADKFAIDGTKIGVHIDKLHHWQYGDRTTLFPIYVEVSPVGHCNHRCTFCAVDYIGYKTRSLDAVRWRDIVFDMGKHQVRSIMFAGEGEPLLHPKIGQMVIDTAAAGIDVAFTTNGVALTDKNLDAILPHTKWIKVSLNAGDKETYAKIHQTKEEDWDKVWSNLSRAVARRGNNTTIGVQCVILPDNITSLEGMLREAQERGLDYAVLKPYSQHKSSSTKTYEEVKYSNQIEKLHEVAQRYTTSRFNVICRTSAMQTWDSQKPKYNKCYSTPYMWAYIMATGDVYGCSAYLLDERFRYGNIKDSLFSEIWLGEKRKQSMDYVDSKLDISQCRLNCRMNKVNEYLWDLKHPSEHSNFI